MATRDERVKRRVVAVAAAVGITIAGYQVGADMCFYRHDETSTLNIMSMTVDGTEVATQYGPWTVSLRAEESGVVLRATDDVTDTGDHRETYVLDQN